MQWPVSPAFLLFPCLSSLLSQIRFLSPLPYIYCILSSLPWPVFLAKTPQLSQLQNPWPVLQNSVATHHSSKIPKGETLL